MGRDRASLTAAARRAEKAGYSTFAMADHLMLPFAPLVALQAVADATTTLRVTQLVLADGFRHPAVLAKELATLDVLSEGRLEIGLGAGWMEAEFEQAGIPFAPAGTRLERLAETIAVLKGLFGGEPFTYGGRHHTISGLRGRPVPVQQPHPPLMVGGGGPRLLALGGRHADIVQVLPGTPAQRGGGPRSAGEYSAAAYREKIGHIRAGAGPRFDDVELATLLLNVTVTDDPVGAARRLMEGAGIAGDPSEVLASPVVAIGSLDEVCAKLRHTRDSLGFSYFTPPPGADEASLEPVVGLLAGT